MKKATLRSAAVVLFIVLAWSCGDDAASDDAPTLEELPELLVNALCPELESCLGEAGARRFFGPGGCTERLRIPLDDGDSPRPRPLSKRAGRVRPPRARLPWRRSKHLPAFSPPHVDERAQRRAEGNVDSRDA